MSVSAPKHKAYAWLVWFLASSFVFYKYILEVSPGVIGKDMMTYFHTTATGLGNLIASYFYAYMLMQLPMGLLLDRFGPKLVMGGSLLLCVIGTFLLALAPHYWLAFFARFITGLGAAVAVLGCMKLIAIWFEPHRFAMIVGLMMTIGMLGAASGDSLVQYLLTFYAWQPLLSYIAVIGFILLIIFSLTVTHQGAPYAQQTQNVSLRLALLGVIKHNQSWVLAIYSGLMFAPISAFSGAWGVPFLHQTLHFSNTTSAENMSLIYYGFAIGAPLWGWLSDRIEKRKGFLIFSTIASLITSTVVLYGSFSLWIVATSLFVFGFSISAFVISFSMIKEINFVLYTATAVGFMNAFNSIASAQIDTWIGFILDKNWGGKLALGHRVYSAHAFHMAMLLVPICLVISLFLLFLIKETYCQQNHGE